MSVINYLEFLMMNLLSVFSVTVKRHSKKKASHIL